MSTAEVLGLTDDRERVIVRLDDTTLEVSLVDIHRAERQLALVQPHAEALTPRVIQQRIRAGETADQIAREAGCPLSSVARYEGPALAERAHHAATARRTQVDGQVVEGLVAGHFGVPADDIAWDAWLIAPGSWQVEASCAGRHVRLRWDPTARRVTAADDASRRALQQAAAEDALTAVLRPVSTSEPVAREVTPTPSDVPAARSPRKARAEVPLWSDISLSVGGRGPASDDD